MCQEALGIESGAISDSQITASSQFDNDHAPFQSRLNFKLTGRKQGAWSALTNNGNQWLQVDLSIQFTTVTSIATQGRNVNNQWVTKYQLQHSNDGLIFHYYKEQGQTVNKVNYMPGVDSSCTGPQNANFATLSQIKC